MKGAISGEIAIYFCTPEGKVFDILPALQSPAVTLNSINDAYAFYSQHGGKLADGLVKEYHSNRLNEFAGKKFDQLSAEGKKIFKDPAQVPAYKIYPNSKKGEDKRELYIKAATDSATKDMRTMVFSKAFVAPSFDGLLEDSAITVVEPGGREYYQWQIARCMLGTYKSNDIEFISPSAPSNNLCLTAPNSWKETLFTKIMKQELKGGNVKYSSDSLEAIHIMEE